MIFKNLFKSKKRSLPEAPIVKDEGPHVYDGIRKYLEQFPCGICGNNIKTGDNIGMRVMRSCYVMSTVIFCPNCQGE